MTEIFIFIMGVLAGNLLILILAKMRYNRMIAAEAKAPETTNVLIEKHDQSFLAYGENYEFLGQSNDLEELLLKILKESEKVKIFVTDPNLVDEIKTFYSSLKSDHSLTETNQPH